MRMQSLLSMFFLSSSILSGSFSLGSFDCVTQSMNYKPLSSDEYQQGKLKHAWLNCSDYFSKDAQRALDKDELQPLTFSGKFGAKLSGFLVKRQSKELIIVVPPFGASLDQQMRFAAIFKEYDVIICACQWSDAAHTRKQSLKFLCAPLKTVFDDAVEVVIDACLWARSQGYQKVHALGSCYGGVLTAASQQKMKKNNLKAFDTIILDSVPPLLSSVLKIAIEDPYGVLKKGKAQTFFWYKYIMNALGLSTVGRYISEFFLSEYNLSHLLKESDVPLLLFYGTDDLLVPEAQWQLFLKDNATRFMKVVSTPTKHLYVSLKEKELYREITQRFLNNELL